MSEISELTEAINRLAIAVERMEPEGQRKSRELAADRAAWKQQSVQQADRKQWALNNGLKDARARGAWARSGLSIEQTKLELLKPVQNCGKKTTAIIMNWIDSIRQESAV